jgi:hypothetical protein
MTSNNYGHKFVNHKSEEMICWTCGYVTPRVADPVAWMAEEEGGMVYLCGAWHGTSKVPYTKEGGEA